MIDILFIVLLICFGIIVYCLLSCNKGQGSFRYTVQILQKKGGEIMLELKCTNEEKVKVTAIPVTTTGKPAALDGAVKVTVISGEGTVEMVDNTSFYCLSSNNPGDTEYLVEADADLGEGVITISDNIRLSVAGALAANLGLTAGTPEPK